MPEAAGTEPLFTPVAVGDLTLANRIAMAPMTRHRAGPDRMPDALIAEYYAQRARAGLIISEATTISPQANGYVNTPGIYTDEQCAGWRPVTDAVHARGGVIFLQLWHTGRVSHSDFHGGALPVSASAIPIEGRQVRTPRGKKPGETPRALETKELPGIVSDYVRAGVRAIEAGFDGVEVHGANGYLIDQFLQSNSNHRTDDYGGSVANRFRLLREIVAGLAAAVGPRRVAVKLSPNNPSGGMGSPDFRETFTYAARELDAFGLAYLHVVDGEELGKDTPGPPMTLEDFRAVYSGVLMGNGEYDRETASAAVARGAADMIAIGRPFITNPDLAERWKNGWPQAPLSEPASWYTLEQTPAGLTDYPPWNAD
ncbi:MAG: alkene reductase [Gemmatimonadetes bacterium]|nr:alkene reductase [Gemmatimonadota bacterium]